ncbi:hypothetical protein HMPREF3230_00061 [Gardnerella vaginalis]|uniref:Uncharacterized protein n=1 Tax=Gardnerella vaginalis TaxID=2702 RepID=A0A135ZBX0_GARVA|nr:hypothetical protein HMPREF3230_00061 [Gardnerella vaginalis]
MESRVFLPTPFRQQDLIAKKRDVHNANCALNAIHSNAIKSVELYIAKQ